VFKIYSAGNITDAYLLQSLLAEAGIDTQILNEYAQGGVGELSFTHAYPELWLIHVADTEQARRIIKKFEQQDDPVGSIQCPNCAESNPDSFEICWRCQTSLNNDHLD
jgi:uncharacterized paraquat-inducible protein A